MKGLKIKLNAIGNLKVMRLVTKQLEDFLILIGFINITTGYILNIESRHQFDGHLFGVRKMIL